MQIRLLVSYISCFAIEIPGETWRSLERPGDPWRDLEIPGETWRSLEIPGETWRDLEVPCLWYILPFFYDMLNFETILK